MPDRLKKMSSEAGKGHRNYIIILLDILIFLAMLKWLPVETKMAQGLAILTFIGILWLTEATHVTITALLVPVLAMILGILPGAKALTSFADPTIFLFFGGFALAGALHEQKIDSWLAGKILLIAKGRLWMALGLIFFVTAFLSMWMSNTATAAMMLPLVIGLLSNLDEREYKSTCTFAVLGVAYSASIGGLGTLVGSPPNAIAAHELQMGFAGWFKVAFPMMFVVAFVVFAVMIFLFRPKLSLHVEMPEDREQDDEEGKNGRLSPKQIRVLILFGITAACWMCSGWISSLFNGIPAIDTLIALCAAVILTVSGVITWSGISKNTDWGVLLLFGGGITLSSVLVETGAAKFLATTVADFGMGHNPLILLLIISAFISMLTEFCSNTASAALVAPLMVTVAREMGISAEPLVLIVGIGASCAFMLPVSTPPNAIAFSTGKVPQMSMIKAGILIDLCLIVIRAFWAKAFWM